MKALIFNNTIMDVVEEEFPVVPEMTWMDAPEGCGVGAEGWILVDGVITAPPPEPAVTYDKWRGKSYPSEGDQLDDLYHKGAFSDEMAAKLKAVKDKWPKDNSGPQTPDEE